MNRAHAFSYFTWLLFAAMAVVFQPAEAQIFNGTTIDSSTIYDSQGLGTYNLSGGSLTLDGSSIFGGDTTIQWNVPISGGTLDFGSTLLTTTGGDLFLTGNPVTLPYGFTLSSQSGSISINSSFSPPTGNNEVGGAISIAQEQNQNDLQKVIEDQGINYITTGQTGPILIGYPDKSYTLSSVQAVPEPSTWVLLLSGMSLLVVMARRKSATF